MTAEVVHLQEVQSVAQHLHVLHEFVHALDVVDKGKRELGSRRHTLDLAWGRACGHAVDAVLKFDLTDVGVEIHAVELSTRLLCHSNVRELEARRLAACAALRRRAEKALDLRDVVLDLVQDILLCGVAPCEKGADFPLERAARDDGLFRQRIAQEWAIDAANGRKVAGCTDVHSCFDAKDRREFQFPLQYALIALHGQSLPP